MSDPRLAALADWWAVAETSEFGNAQSEIHGVIQQTDGRYRRLAGFSIAV